MMSRNNGTQTGLDCYFVDIADLNVDLPAHAGDKNPFDEADWCKSIAVPNKSVPLTSRWVYALCFVGEGKKARLYAEYNLDEEGQVARALVEDRLTTSPSARSPVLSPAAPTFKLSTHLNGETVLWFFVVAHHRLAARTLRRYANFILANPFDLGAYLRDRKQGVAYAVGKMGGKQVYLPVYDLVRTQGLLLSGPRPGLGIPVIDFVTVALTRRAQYIAAADRYLAAIQPTSAQSQAIVSRYLLALFVKQMLRQNPTLVEHLENQSSNRVDDAIAAFPAWLEKERLALEVAAFRLVTLLKSRYWETVGHAHFDVRDGARSKALADLHAHLEDRLHESEIGRRYLRSPSVVTLALLEACGLGDVPKTGVERFLETVPWAAAGEPSLGAAGLIFTHVLPTMYRDYTTLRLASRLAKAVEAINAACGKGNEIYVLLGKGTKQFIADGGGSEGYALRALHGSKLDEIRYPQIALDEKAVARVAKAGAVLGRGVMLLKTLADVWNNFGKIVAAVDKEKDKRTWFDVADAAAGGATIGKNVIEVIWLTAVKSPSGGDRAVSLWSTHTGPKAALAAFRVLSLYAAIVDVAAAFNDKASADEDGDFEAGWYSFYGGMTSALNGALALCAGLNPLILVFALAAQAGFTGLAMAHRHTKLQNFLRHCIFGVARHEQQGDASPSWAVGRYQDWTNDAKGLALQLETLYPLLTRFIVASAGRATIEITFGYYAPGTVLTIVYADELSPGRTWLEIDLDASSFKNIKPLETDSKDQPEVVEFRRHPASNALTSLRVRFRGDAQPHVTRSVVRVFLSTVLHVAGGQQRELLSPQIPVLLDSPAIPVVGENAKRLMRSLDRTEDQRGVMHAVIEETGSYKIWSFSKPTPSIPA